MEYGLTPPEERKKGLLRKPWFWVLGALAALLLILLVVGLLTDWFGFYGPLTKIAFGAKKLGDAGSTTAQFVVAAPGDTQADGTLACSWDLENRVVAADLQLQLNGKTFRYGIVDGHVVWRDSRDRAKSVDISRELDKFFDSLESESDLDESLEELLEAVFKTAGIHKMVDSGEAVACLKDGFLKWNRTGWLEENAGYSLEREDGTVLHSFEPKTGKLLLEVTKQFEPAFEQRSDYRDVISGLREKKSELSKNYDFELVFGLANGALSMVKVDVDWNGVPVSAKIDLRKIGTTNVDVDFLRQLKTEADN